MLILQPRIPLHPSTEERDTLVHMVVTSPPIGSVHATGSSSLIIVSTRIFVTKGMDGLALTPGRRVMLPFIFNMAPETLSPKVTLRL